MPHTARPRRGPTRRRRVLLLACASVALGAVLSVAVVPSESVVYATDVFGSLRAPGDPAFIAGHRGDRSVAPENTLPSLEAALANPALGFIETDVQLTKDGVPVLFHDTTLKRITGHRGAIADYDWAQLRTFDAGSWYAEEYAGVHIPTFASLLDRLAKTEKRALVELKYAWTPDEVSRLVSLIEERGLGSRVVLASFSFETLESIQAVAPRTQRLMLVREITDDPVPVARMFGVLAVATTAKAIAAHPDAVQRMHAANLGLLCYTLNTEETWDQARSLGVDGIITDVPSELDAWLAMTSRGT
ncbi:MAG: glycerophosphodiester phosphodiesterase family protein [Leifsonia sp.]